MHTYPFILVGYGNDTKFHSNAFFAMDISVFVFAVLYEAYIHIAAYTYIPFTDSNQLFVILRSGRRSWVTGQLLYVFMTSAVYYLFIFAATLLLSLPYSDWSTEWGKVINTIANTDIAQNNGAYFVEASSLITTFFTPIQAVWFTFLLSVLSASVLGLIIFLLNITTNTRSIGIAVSASLTVLSFMVANGDLGYLLKFSPLSWNTLNNIDVGGKTSNPSFVYCIAVYITAIVILTALIMIRIRCSSIESRKRS